MKKKLLIFLSSLMLSVSLVGCGSNSEDGVFEYRQIGDRTFVVINNTPNDCIYVDINTKVQYVRFTGGYQGSMSVLVDADGKPILYEGELE